MVFVKKILLFILTITMLLSGFSVVSAEKSAIVLEYGDFYSAEGIGRR